jgi:hypothetical protein
MTHFVSILMKRLAWSSTKTDPIVTYAWPGLEPWDPLVTAFLPFGDLWRGCLDRSTAAVGRQGLLGKPTTVTPVLDQPLSVIIIIAIAMCHSDQSLSSSSS